MAVVLGSRSHTLLGLLWLACSWSAWAVEPCTPALARVVSVQGKVELRRGGAEWAAVALNAPLCSGDTLRVLPYGRAALLLSNETTLRLDQGTTLTLAPPETGKATLLQQLSGGLHVITRTPRAFNVKTPFVNANVEGTEFSVRVSGDAAVVAVMEGRIVASNESGSVALTRGEQARAVRNAAPRKELLLRPLDAVQWALYVPALFERAPDEGVALDGSSARAMVRRGVALLLVGRLDEAAPLLERALELEPRNSDALALMAVVAVAGNDKDGALNRGEEAVAADPASATAWLALSYAQQARFDLAAARASVQRAVEANPDHALARARLAELDLSLGYVGRAVAQARRAVEMSPGLAKPHSVLGFAYLARQDAALAREAFEASIVRDDADPIARLGLGLALIRAGELSRGREEIEIAASLDPARSLTRTYLGKAYFEESRDALAQAQWQQAMELDPNDPTPWFYAAVLAQSDNRPAQALADVETSLALNRGRAVYRSMLLLNQDEAARTVAKAKIYADLGFERLALLDGARSVDEDPTNYAAHRLLADAYVDVSRHDIARVSELLQSQLRQPLTMTPTQLQLSEDRFVLLRGSGPSSVGLNEFNALFNRDGVGGDASGIVGGNQTAGGQVSVTGIHGRLGFSIGQLSYHTEGFRENDDFRKTIYDLFVQQQASESFSWQAEARRSSSVFGDTVLRFDPQLFLPDRNELVTTSYRLGLRYQASPESEWLGSLTTVDGAYENGQLGTTFVEQSARTYIGEVQHVWRHARFDLISGLGASSEKTQSNFLGMAFDSRTRARNAYVYASMRLPGERVRVHAGVSFEQLKATGELGGSTSQTNPKLGLSWALSPQTTVRAAAFRTLKRRFLATQTLEPTQVAGFNQFFDDMNGTDARRIGVALDHRLSQRLFAGAEASRRKLDVPQDFTASERFDWRERAASAHVYWVQGSRLAWSARYHYERFDRPAVFPGSELFTNLVTHRVPLGMDVHHPSGWSVRLRATHVRQEGFFFTTSSFDPEPGSDRFWIADLSAGYRLPNRRGMVSIEVKNLFDRQFRYQETDLFNPAMARRRVSFLRASLVF